MVNWDLERGGEGEGEGDGGVIPWAADDTWMPSSSWQPYKSILIYTATLYSEINLVISLSDVIGLNSSSTKSWQSCVKYLIPCPAKRLLITSHIPRASAADSWIDAQILKRRNLSHNLYSGAFW